MKVSWRNAGEEKGALNHHHSFSMGEKREGRGPRDFMLHLINETQAVEVALDNKVFWSTSSYGGLTTDELVLRAMMGEPRQASVLVSVDYTTQDDWIDSECRACGCLWGTHVDCPTLKAVDKGWADVVRVANGR